MKGASSVVLAAVCLLALPFLNDASISVTLNVGGTANLQNCVNAMTYKALAVANYVTHFPYMVSSDAKTAQSGLLNGAVKLVTTEESLDPSLYEQYMAKNVLQMPLALATVSFFHRIGAWTTALTQNPLQLTPDAVAGILSGNVTTWTDPIIVKSNNGSRGSTDIRTLVAPGTPIKLAGLSTPSMTTQSTLQWLMGASTVAAYGNTSYSPFEWDVPVNMTMPWPDTAQMFTTEAALISYLQKTNNSLAFMDSRAGLVAGKLNESSLLNQEGNFLTSQQTAWLGFPSKITIPGPMDYKGWAAFNLNNRIGWKSYPIAFVVNLFTPQNVRSEGNGGAVQQQLLGYLYGSTGQNASTSQYLFKLPTTLVNTSITAVNTMETSSNLTWQGSALASGFVAAVAS